VYTEVPLTVLVGIRGATHRNERDTVSKALCKPPSLAIESSFKRHDAIGDSIVRYRRGMGHHVSLSCGFPVLAAGSIHQDHEVVQFGEPDTVNCYCSQHGFRHVVGCSTTSQSDSTPDVVGGEDPSDRLDLITHGCAHTLHRAARVNASKHRERR